MADRRRHLSLGGQHLANGTLWRTACSIFGGYSSQGVEGVDPSDWRGS